MNKLLFILCLLFSLASQAQDSIVSKKDSVEVAFTISFSKANKLTTSQRQELKDKLTAVLARTQTSGLINSQFSIEPDVKLTNRQTTASTKETMTLIEGELTLVAKNRYTGKAYNEQTIHLRELVRGISIPDPEFVLIKAINVKDKRFVRFVKTSINRIVEYYQSNK